jgi:hypothetical protein
MKTPLLHLAIAAVVCLLALAGYGVSYVMIASERAAVTSLENQIDKKNADVNRANAARVVLSEIAGDEAVIQGYFVPETGVVAFIDELQSRGRRQGATITVLSVASEGTAEKPLLALTLTITGGFDAVMRTVGAIEYAPYDISIRTLSVGEQAAKNWHADLTLSVGSRVPDTDTTTP